MNKKIVVSGIIIAALAAIAGYAAIRLEKRGTDIIGVTTLPQKNTVIMNAKTGKEFVSGSGRLTVGEGERIHLEYDLDAGSFDLALHAAGSSLDVFLDADLTGLPDAGELFGKSGVTGSGSLELEAASGEYTVFFNMHDAIGTARVSASAANG